MRGSSIGYLIKEGARSIAMNAMMSFASVGVLSSCMLLIGCSIMFGLNVKSIVGYVESQNEVIAIIVDGLDDVSLAKLEEDINQVGNVSSVKFVDKQQGLEEWMGSMGDDGELLEIFKDDNPLPHTYRLVITELSTMRETVEEIKQIIGIDTVNAPIEVADTIGNLKQAVDVIGVVVIGMLGTVSFVVITNTIKITVFNRKKEINIMKYVGATDGFIRLPFLVEGVLLGILSATASFLILWGGYEALINYISTNQIGWTYMIGDNIVPFKDAALNLYIGFLSGGIFLGGFGSMAFIGKYIKV